MYVEEMCTTTPQLTEEEQARQWFDATFAMMDLADDDECFTF